MVITRWTVLGCVSALILLGCGGADDGGATGGTVHEGELIADATWAADGNPHIIASFLNIREGATLTLEPGVVVKLVVGGEINIGSTLLSQSGRLVAEGTAAAPIEFSAGEGGTWAHIRVEHPGTASFAHVVLDGGGNNAIFFGASLVVQGGFLPPVARIVTVDSVTVQNSDGAGVMLARWGGFTAESKDLTITGSGQGGLDPGYPLRAQTVLLSSVPSGTFTGNEIDEILIDPSDTIDEDTVIPDLGLPYRVDGSITSSLTVAQASAVDPIPTLTLPAGVTVCFEPGMRLQVGSETRRGALRLEGAPGNEAILTSTVPTAGSWVGVDFLLDPGAATNVVDHARIEYAGGDCGCDSLSCNGIVDATPENAAVLIRNWRPATAFVTNTEILASGGHGINRGWASDLAGPDFASPNTFVNIAACTQTTPRDAAGACPGGATCP